MAKMAFIISSKVRDDRKIVFEIIADANEAQSLKGHVDKIHLIAEDVCDEKTQISGRGANESTKYFLIPKSARKDLDTSHEVKYQVIDSDDKKIFIFVVEK